ncbi:DivIVA domain-containing protein [Acidaminobacter sp. JC074]|uniref:DivIVA domain-containing protein n=1 Tax=Acidaminobacter sp. JC074 TaxID=2530199 RepID=UPI001F0FE62D|nr:DivIVA domain-containing protein [Acidaminobacter sp. JC074]MCH4890236.1 DivIVA domain-containing protein [Acidaminobacter sp. JC074]
MLTPNDIAGKTFTKALNGYNKAEVDDYLEKVSDHLESVIREFDYLKTQIVDTEKKLTDYQLQEESLKDALLVAQIAASDVKKKADAEAKKIVSAAEAEATKVMKIAEDEASETRRRAKEDADKNIEQAKQQYKDILDATEDLKKGYMDFKEKYQYILREQIDVLDRLNVEEHE